MATVTTPSSAPGNAALPPVRQYHKFRKTIHFICVLIFVALPFSNLMRFDIPRQRFYVFGQELWINEFAILFFTLMFLLFTIAAASMLYGRVYCSYACPQMIFSEASLAVEDRIRRWVNKHFIQLSAGVRTFASKFLFYASGLVASMFLAFVFTSYFVEPRDLLGRLMTLDIVTAGGIAGAVTTLITFLDFAFVRTRFCKMICPYGYLQGMLSDKQTLLVVYRDGEEKQKACIECKKCVRVCHMGIDIRKSPFQIECIHCGECVEACDEVLAKLKKPGLIHYTWGEQGAMLGSKEEGWLRRIGLRDPKRAVVSFIMLFYFAGLMVALSMRHPVQVRVQPDRATLYTSNAQGETTNKFRFNIDNRGSVDATVAIQLETRESALHLTTDRVSVTSGGSVMETIEVATAPDGLKPGVYSITLHTVSEPGAIKSSFPMTFVMPKKK
ncbi:MAG: 4Fe-4S binding protein [Bryobacterales bacterium]|nr:4Fe-4S binding protein [Bryobacterales bacterium]